jgi:hypothetical protein
VRTYGPFVVYCPIMVQLDTVALVRANVDACAFSTYPLVVLVVPLRLWCRVRHVGRQGIGWDDIICIIALLLHSAFFFLCMFGNVNSSP